MSNSSEENPDNLCFVLVGAGRLGSLLCLELYNRGIAPVKIITRNPEKAVPLAKSTANPPVSSKPEIDGNPDFILITVNDDSIREVLERLSPTNVPVIHCSGSTSMEVFPAGMPNHGVLYPMQSFSGERVIDFTQIPILIEASNDATYKILRYISGRLGSRVIPADSAKRMKSHIAAVFASNFSYHFIILARDYLARNNIDPNILDPLIRETLNKALEFNSENLQTGPAVREDYIILEKHQEALKNNPSLQKLYTFVSESIIHHNKAKKINDGEF